MTKKKLKLRIKELEKKNKDLNEAVMLLIQSIPQQTEIIYPVTYPTSIQYPIVTYGITGHKHAIHDRNTISY